MPSPVATIRITGDPDNSGTTRTGTFEIMGGSEDDGGFSYNYGVRTGYVTEGAGASVNAFVSDVAGGNLSNTKGIYSTAGGSQFTVELDFNGWIGDGGQWGDTGKGGSKTDATGEGPKAKMDVLSYWLRHVALDSLPSWAANVSAGPAELEIAGYSANGRFGDALDVVMEGPTVTRGSQTPSTYSGAITCIEAADLGEAIDAAVRKVF